MLGHILDYESRVHESPSASEIFEMSDLFGWRAHSIFVVSRKRHKTRRDADGDRRTRQFAACTSCVRDSGKSCLNNEKM